MKTTVKIENFKEFDVIDGSYKIDTSSDFKNLNRELEHIKDIQGDKYAVDLCHMSFTDDGFAIELNYPPPPPFIWEVIDSGCGKVMLDDDGNAILFHNMTAKIRLNTYSEILEWFALVGYSDGKDGILKDYDDTGVMQYKETNNDVYALTKTVSIPAPDGKRYYSIKRFNIKDEDFTHYKIVYTDGTISEVKNCNKLPRFDSKSTKEFYLYSITKDTVNLNFIWYGCSSMKIFECSADTSNVTSMYYTWYGCRSLPYEDKDTNDDGKNNIRNYKDEADKTLWSKQI